MFTIVKVQTPVASEQETFCADRYPVNATGFDGPVVVVEALLGATTVAVVVVVPRPVGNAEIASIPTPRAATIAIVTPTLISFLYSVNWNTSTLPRVGKLYIATL